MKIVLDTETAGGFDNPLVYDIGYVVADNNGAIVKTRSYVIKEVYDNAELFESAYYKDKKSIYEERLKTGATKKVNLAYALYRLQKDIDKYGAEKFAYNSKFDSKALTKSIDKFNKSKYKLVATDIKDIMQFIDNIVNTQNYKQFCTNNKMMTKHKRPRPQKKAETLFRYLTNNPNYTEEHTALEDSKIELFILLTALGLSA